jgi:hypothetical protein
MITYIKATVIYLSSVSETSDFSLLEVTATFFQTVYGRISKSSQLCLRRLVHMSGPADLADNFAKSTIAPNTERHVGDPSYTCPWSPLLVQLCSGFNNQFPTALRLFTLLRLFAVLRLRFLTLRLLVLRLLLLLALWLLASQLLVLAL